MTNRIRLVLFENDATKVQIHYGHGISNFMVDMELLGKDLRQKGFDTEIRPGTIHDLSQIARSSGVEAWCRLNCFGPHTAGEVEEALAAGAHVIMLPMVSHVSDAEAFLCQVGSRALGALMIETVQGVEIAAQLGSLRPAHVFFGLNDFAIDRGGGSIFRAISDGTVERVRRAIPSVSFGFGGLTDPRSGSPIPCQRLLEEMERLDCQFTFLRRSFRRDAKLTLPGEIVGRIQTGWAACRARLPEQRQADHDLLCDLIHEL